MKKYIAVHKKDWSECEIVNFLIDANSNAKKIASSFTMYDDLVNANSFNDTNMGMNAIMRLIKSNKLSPDIIQNYSKPVLKGRLDILYSAIANTNTEERENLISMPLIAKNADEVYDLVLIDLPKTMTDDSAIRVMEQADILELPWAAVVDKNTYCFTEAENWEEILELLGWVFFDNKLNDEYDDDKESVVNKINDWVSSVADEKAWEIINDKC